MFPVIWAGQIRPARAQTGPGMMVQSLGNRSDFLSRPNHIQNSIFNIQAQAGARNSHSQPTHTISFSNRCFLLRQGNWPGAKSRIDFPLHPRCMPAHKHCELFNPAGRP